MKKRIAALLLSLAASAAAAQSLSYGVNLGNLEAVRDNNTAETVITGTLANLSNKRIEHAEVEFALYDADGREIGRIRDASDKPLDPGEVWQVRASTPLAIARFTAVHIKAE
ncbi:FxLYD domain-containing protein [Bordetella genomosp. 1]|uniref:DUF5666 domain-containing protein n=1 Tax=Bordetella genomosp. 1 TaxID=1395607 RepID=A0ABX4F2S5_9BORD|nr:FxLYD domain-containing protein [Bordetella genomosp. 1]OZI68060.1 hypothetical protein CAL27_00890 [Bordetella genomosp. 1]